MLGRLIVAIALMASSAIYAEPAVENWDTYAGMNNGFFPGTFLCRRLEFLESLLSSESYREAARESGLIHNAVKNQDRADLAAHLFHVNERLGARSALEWWSAEAAFDTQTSWEKAYGVYEALARQLFNPAQCHYRMAEISFRRKMFAEAERHFAAARKYDAQLGPSIPPLTRIRLKPDPMP